MDSPPEFISHWFHLPFPPEQAGPSLILWSPKSPFAIYSHPQMLVLLFPSLLLPIFPPQPQDQLKLMPRPFHQPVQ